MAQTLLVGGVLLDPEADEPLRADLLLDRGRIEARIGPNDARPEMARQIDVAGLLIAPGLIDLHVHGSAVFQAAEFIEDAIRADAASSVRHGVTANLVTTVAWDLTRVMEFSSQFASVASWDAADGSVPIGLHLEGPWISGAAAGAQPAAAIREYRAAAGAELLAAVQDTVRMVTLAPEVAGAAELLAELARRDIVAALGHSRAGLDAIDAAVAAGARHVTHLYNAMGPLHHREPGLAAAGLTDDRLSCDLICDGVHVHPRMVAVAARACGDRLALISDRVEPQFRIEGPENIEGPEKKGRENPGAALADEAGSGADFGSGAMRDDGTAWRLADGRLAGSRLTLDHALRNLIEFAHVTPLAAVAACSLRPARILGIEAERGSLRVGARADLALFDDALGLRETWIDGQRVYSQKSPSPAPHSARPSG
jgi:N-acetylglucosamine-6-phosphate deacetylase